MALLPNYKEIVELMKKGSTLEAQEKIMELREGALELQENNMVLTERIKELETQLKIKSNVVWKEPLYWHAEDSAQEARTWFAEKGFDKEMAKQKSRSKEDAIKAAITDYKEKQS